MLITDQIRKLQWYDMGAPLESEKMKLFDEYFALAVLRYCYPENYKDYNKKEAPDLQRTDGKYGVEVTLAISSVIAPIEGNLAKYQLQKDQGKKAALKTKMEKGGARFDSIGISYPVETEKQDYDAIKTVIEKKVKRLKAYHEKGFEKMDLFIRCSSMPCTLSKATFISLFAKATGYETVYLTAPSCLLSYQHSNQRLLISEIPREDFEALNVIARLTVDGKIKPESSIWNTY